jgi:hypothetical protein
VKGGELVSHTQIGGEPHSTCFNRKLGDALLHIESTNVYARGSR